MKTKQMTIFQILAVCALLTASLFAVAAQTKSKSGSQNKKQPPPKAQRIKGCCFETESGGLRDCNKPMPNGLCPASMVTVKCSDNNYNDCKK